MVVTNRQSGTNVHEVADAIYRIRQLRSTAQGDSRSINTLLRMTNHCSSTPARERCFAWCVKRSGASCPSRTFATLRSPTWKPTSAAHSTSGLPLLRSPYRCAGRLRPWYRFVTLLIGRRARLRMESCSFWAGTPCVGSIRRICRTRGNVAC